MITAAWRNCRIALWKYESPADVYIIPDPFKFVFQQRLFVIIREREYDLDYSNVIYVGGGAAAAKNFSEHKPNIAYDCDIHANAKGYEYLAWQILRNQGAA